jgi:hypothetical protein
MSEGTLRVKFVTWSTNALEPLNPEVKRRADVVGVFPTPPRSGARQAPSCPNNMTNGTCGMSAATSSWPHGRVLTGQRSDRPATHSAHFD